MKKTQLETLKVQVSFFKYMGNYNMILQMQMQVDNQVKTMSSHITKDHIHQMSSHINTECENGAYHQNPGPGQHQHGALKLLLTPCAMNGAWSKLVTLALTYASSH